MKETTQNLLVGLFIVTALAALALLMVAFGEAPSWLGGSEWTLRITGVNQLSGISEGSPVNLNGVEIGRVTSLEFEDPSRPDLGVMIVTGIKKRYSVPQGAVARLYGATLGFGTGRIDIFVEPGTKAEPMDKEFALMRGEMRNVINELISKDMVGAVEQTITHIGQLAEAAKPVAKNLAILIERRSVADVDQPESTERVLQANFSTVMERVDDLVANINTILGDDKVQDDVKTAVGDLKTATEQLRQTATLWKTATERISKQLTTGIDRTQENLDKSFARLTDVLNNLDDASKGMARLMNRIDDGEGTAGLLVRDDRLYEAGVLTLERMSELIATLQRILGKAEEDGYIKIGQKTSLGTFKVDVPVGKLAAKVLEKFTGEGDGTPLVEVPSSTGQ